MELVSLNFAPFPKELILKKLEESGIHINRYAEILFLHGGFSTEGGYEGTLAIASLREIGLEDGAALSEISARARGYFCALRGRSRRKAKTLF